MAQEGVPSRWVERQLPWQGASSAPYWRRVEVKRCALRRGALAVPCGEGAQVRQELERDGGTEEDVLEEAKQCDFQQTELALEGKPREHVVQPLVEPGEGARQARCRLHEEHAVRRQLRHGDAHAELRLRGQAGPPELLRRAHERTFDVLGQHDARVLSATGELDERAANVLRAEDADSAEVERRHLEQRIAAETRDVDALEVM